MIKSILCFILVGAIGQTCFGQDTIRMEPSVIYTSQEIKELTTKGFQGNYSKENIIYAKNHIRVEYCYYENELRNCIGTDYKIENDSSLIIGDFSTDFYSTIWNFEKVENGNYLIYRTNDGLYQFGEAEQLVPLKMVSPIPTTFLNSEDTLWIETYQKKQNKLGEWVHQFYESKIDGKLYEYDEIDKPPTQLNGLPLEQVTIESIAPCYCEPMGVDISTVAIIISKDGKIKNVDQAIGWLSDSCPETMKEIIQKIYNWGTLTPAIKKGQKVNVRWFISIENLQREKLHPAFEDNPKNRKRYIKLKKKGKKLN